MASSTAARRYAQAMIELADGHGAIEQVGRDLRSFASLMSDHGRLLGNALRSPVFTIGERRAVLDQVLPKLQLHGLTENVVRLANDKGRLGLLPEIAAAYHALADERAGRIQVTVQTAEPMSPELTEEVRKALEAQTRKTVVLNSEVDPSLIGGMVARVGGKVYDSSIRTRLEQIKGALVAGALPAQA